MKINNEVLQLRIYDLRCLTSTEGRPLQESGKNNFFPVLLSHNDDVDNRIFKTPLLSQRLKIDFCRRYS
jgi:hypothetical protein